MIRNSIHRDQASYLRVTKILFQLQVEIYHNKGRSRPQIDDMRKRGASMMKEPREQGSTKAGLAHTEDSETDSAWTDMGV